MLIYVSFPPSVRIVCHMQYILVLLRRERGNFKDIR